jgi:hypothetical protein
MQAASQSPQPLSPVSGAPLEVCDGAHLNIIAFHAIDELVREGLQEQPPSAIGEPTPGNCRKRFVAFKMSATKRFATSLDWSW